MLRAYRFACMVCAPLILIWLLVRWRGGKEHPTRWRERLGIASLPRPSGRVLWLHAASVGEFNAALPFIQLIVSHQPDSQMLVTTGTVTSASLAATRLPAQAMHQFVPVDLPFAVRRFLQHWQPDGAIWTESEFWPNLIDLTARQCPMMAVNVRLSARSARCWARTRRSFSRLLAPFGTLYAASHADAAHLALAGITDVQVAGNLKYDAEPLPHQPDDATQLRAQIGSRPVWLAASTHEGEEALVLQAHARLISYFPDLLTIIAPRHPQRSAAVQQLLTHHATAFACRSLGEAITAGTTIYLADTLGEMGLWFRLCPVVFLGGSLVPVGGHNPIEPAQLDCAIVSGGHVHHFADLFVAWQSEQAVRIVDTADALADTVRHWFDHPAEREKAQRAAHDAVAKRRGVAAALYPLLCQRLDAAHSARPS